MPAAQETNETADFGEADQDVDQEQIEREYEFRASQIKAKLLASGAQQDIGSLASESLNQRDDDDDDEYNYPASKTQANFMPGG